MGGGGEKTLTNTEKQKFWKQQEDNLTGRKILNGLWGVAEIKILAHGNIQILSKIITYRETGRCREYVVEVQQT